MKTPDNHEHNLARRVMFFLKFLEIRLRFALILVITALVVGYWDHIQNYFERWQRNHGGHEQAAGGGEGAESEFEFFCPMHPFVIRNHAGKCPICGMDMVQRKKGAVAVLPAGTLARVQVSPERVMQAGIQVEPVSYRLLTQTVRSYGIVEPDETRLARIIARFPGRIDELMVNTAGVNVKKGEALARIYSPRFLTASAEYLQALSSQRRIGGGAGGDGKGQDDKLVAYSRQRLLLAGFTEAQLDEIARQNKPSENVTLFAPLGGTVLEKNVLAGDTVEEGTALYTIADLSKLWVQVQVIEADLAAVKLGMPVEVTTVAYPGRIFYGTVDFVYPTVTTENRSGKVRVVIENPEGMLKPGMYVNAAMRSLIGQDEPSTVKMTDGAATGTATVSGAASTTVTTTSTPAAATTVTTPSVAVKLPTGTQAEADRYLGSLPDGATYYECPMHADVVSDKAGDCPKCGMHLEQKTKAGVALKGGPSSGATSAPGVPADTVVPIDPSTKWVEGWECPMHPDELSAGPGKCSVCGCGMDKVKMRVARVPSVPESAVIDTGERRLVYVESAPGIYDARAVVLGPRSGQFYPVLDGLKLGERVAAQGSFLIDAEARLNPSAVGGDVTGAGKPGVSNTSGTSVPAGGHQHAG